MQNSGANLPGEQIALRGVEVLLKFGDHLRVAELEVLPGVDLADAEVEPDGHAAKP